MRRFTYLGFPDTELSRLHFDLRLSSCQGQVCELWKAARGRIRRCCGDGSTFQVCYVAFVGPDFRAMGMLEGV
jgi:hypothetical protein